MQIVAGHVAEHLGDPSFQLAGLASRDLPNDLDHIRNVGAGRVCPRRAPGLPCSALRLRPEHGHPPVGQHRFHGQHVVGHDPVADRAGASAVVADHPAQRGAAGGGHVHRKAEVRRRQPAVQLVQHQTRLDPCGARLSIHFQQPVQVPRRVHDHGPPHRLTALRGPAATGQHRRPLFAGRAHHGLHVVQRARQDHPQRLDLVDGGVGGVEAARGRVEPHVALHVSAQAGGKSRAVVGGWAGHYYLRLCKGRRLLVGPRSGWAMSGPADRGEGNRLGATRLPGQDKWRDRHDKRSV